MSDVAEAVEAAVEERVEAAVEHAQERVAEAERMAQAVTDAAVMSEMGRNVAEMRTEFHAWRSGIEERLSAQHLLTEKISAELAAVTSVLAEALTEPEESMEESSHSTPPISEETHPEGMSHANPGDAGGRPEAEPNQPAPAERKKRRLI